MAKDKFKNNLKNYLIPRYDIDRLIDDTHTLLASSKMFNLYIRHSLPQDRKHSLWDNKTLIIANISFKDQRVGNGTSLLQFLVTQSKVLNFEKIGIEMTNAIAESFAKRHGFTKVNEKNWVINIKDLMLEQSITIKGYK